MFHHFLKMLDMYTDQNLPIVNLNNGSTIQWPEMKQNKNRKKKKEKDKQKVR